MICGCHLGCMYDNKSSSNYFLKIYKNIVSYTSIKQKCLHCWLQKAKLTELCESICESMWLTKWLKDFDNDNVKLKIFEHNRASLKILKNPEINKSWAYWFKVSISKWFIKEENISTVLSRKWKTNGSCFSGKIATKYVPYTPY